MQQPDRSLVTLKQLGSIPWDLLVFICTLLVGLGILGGALWQGHFAPWWNKGTPNSLLTGQWTAEFSESVNDAPGLEVWARLHREGAYLLMGSYGPNVRAGCEDWLFLQEEIQAVSGEPQENIIQRLRAVKQIHTTLRKNNVQLYIVMVPDKSRVEKGQLCDLPRPRSYESRLEQWNRALSSEAVAVIDTTASLVAASKVAPAYWRLDTHWNQHGARHAANAVSDYLQAHQAIPNATLQTTIQVGASQPRKGDLIRLADLEHLPEQWLPPADTEQILNFQFTALQENGLSDEDLESQLFDEPQHADVVLVGTSFSRTADFGRFLSTALKTNVINLAEDGAGMLGPMKAFMQQSQEQGEWPVQLLWEIPERYIQTPIAESEQSWLETLLTLP
ncbi:alginate O-acetyltransferase AlgX-related protein [Alcaligenes endophyticus]|uniref:AlgX/AlgJ SGNH hydrolase-like domain-containing protein n=1 Tax=Alcaligenes endophyticus TaxID=1929088 RepID=A0ABT8EES0_9BURK|nr:hypothetical protein [Alcaligenes endophyticus]MCX5592338.1 hypothetical protein [Alcaligenes endophyticus]MDN4119781.1 hypothetical protein [Alcaligenes endophyticus]